MINELNNGATAEIWADIQGYNGKYSISNMGRVRSNNRFVEASNSIRKYPETIYAQQIGYGGYRCVSLRGIDRKNKTCYVHRLVATHFVDNPDGKDYVNHKDGNKHNNHSSNLEWVTWSENCKHAISMGLSTPIHKRYKHKTGKDFHTSVQVMKFKDGIFICVYESITHAAKENKTNTNTIVSCSRIKKEHKGFEYELIKLRQTGITWDQLQEYTGKPKSDLPEVLFRQKEEV